MSKWAGRQVVAFEDAVAVGGATGAVSRMRRRESAARRQADGSRRRDARAPGTGPREGGGGPGDDERARAAVRVPVLRRVHAGRAPGAVGAAAVHRVGDRIRARPVGPGRGHRGGGAHARESAAVRGDRRAGLVGHPAALGRRDGRRAAVRDRDIARATRSSLATASGRARGCCTRGDRAARVERGDRRFCRRGPSPR